MWTQTIKFKNGIVTVKKTAGNIPVSALAQRDDGAKWEVRNPYGITDTDRHDAEDFVS